MINFILNASILLLIVFLITYFMYCFGLFFVLKKLNGRAWLAFLPVINFHELVISLKLPNKWFLYSLIPYAGSIYAVGVAERLGKAFGRNFVFSSFWLTIGSPIGMNIIGLSGSMPAMEILERPAPSIKDVSKRLKSLRK